MAYDDMSTRFAAVFRSHEDKFTECAINLKMAIPPFLAAEKALLSVEANFAEKIDAFKADAVSSTMTGT